MHWFYPYRSFKHSKWWHHELGHIERLMPSFVQIDEKFNLSDGF